MNNSPEITDVFGPDGSLMYRVNTSKMKPIPGYPGYFATANGSILTTGMSGVRLGSSHPYPLAEHVHKPGEGYKGVSLTVTSEGKARTKNKPVHQLVCLAFKGKPSSDQTDTRHLNGIPHDNRSINLVWGSHRENYEDSVRHGTAIGLRKGQRHPASKLCDEDVPLIRGFRLQGYSLSQIADHFGVTKECIRAVVSGETWVHVLGVQEATEPPSSNTARNRRGLADKAG